MPAIDCLCTLSVDMRRLCVYLVHSHVSIYRFSFVFCWSLLRPAFVAAGEAVTTLAGVTVSPGAAPASTTPDAIQASQRSGRSPGATGGAVPLSPGEPTAAASLDTALTPLLRYAIAQSSRPWPTTWLHSPTRTQPPPCRMAC